MKRILLALFTLCFVSVYAQKTWVAGGGTGSGNWNTAANWSGGTVPTASDSVVITGASNGGAIITIDANGTCGALYMIGGGSATGPLLQFPSSGAITLTVTGGISISGGSGTAPNTRPKFTSNGNSSATLVLNGYAGVNYLTSSSNTVANNSTGFNMNEGNVILAGSNSATITASAGLRFGNLQIGDGTNPKTVLYTQTTASTLTITGLTVKTGSTFNFGGNNVVSPNLGSNNINGVSSWTNGLTIESGATMAIQPSSAANLSFLNILGGDIVNNGTLTLSATNRNANVNLTNATGLARTRNISGTGSITFSGLTINDTLGTININRPVTVNDSITLNRGIVTTTTTNLITLGASCNVNNGSTLSHISGPIAHTWSAANATKTFPLGKSGIYRPLVLALTTPSSPVIRAELFNSNPTGTLAGGIVSQNFYYQTSLISGTATAGGTAQINFNTATDGVSNTATLGVGQATTVSGAYTNLGNSVNTATSVTSATYNPASGNFLALVSTSGNTLPVKWSSFTATKNADASLLRWSTASETHNSHFEIQRSADGKNFEAIGKVKGSGNSNKNVNYSFTDKEVATSKTTYYRLKQVDFDGKADYSKTVSVINTIAKAGIGATLPNPFNSDLNISFNAAAAATANLVIMDMLGKAHHSSTEQLQVGVNTINVNTTDMPDGIYFVRVSYNGETFTQKVIKK